MISPKQYLQKVISFFQENGNIEIAEGQMNYMRNKFEFYGVKAPGWVKFSKEIMKSEGIFRNEKLKEFVRLCLNEEHREIHYFGLQMVEKATKKEAEDFIDFLEELILTHSWWDSVDWISKMVGWHFMRFPKQVIPVTERWISSGNIWLQRIAIIFQRYKNYPTDEKMLFDYILRVKDSEEFFIQKGAGWALRDHSKTNPAEVVNFIKNNKFPSLTEREGLKWLKKNGVS
ncbi:MAG: DNA alkylation repair protein [Saprospiraceae bacterium]